MQEGFPRQKCPNCGHLQDISVYVTGQRLRCRCGLHFEVRREDARASSVAAARSRPATPIPAARSNGLVGTALSPAAPDRSPAGIAPSPVATQVLGSSLPATVISKVPQIPGYELSDLLGRGGMGEVWKARQLSLNRAVAVKLLSPDLAGEQDFVRRFEKEAAALAALSHPNIVQIIDRGCCEQTRTWFFVMELCEGSGLRDLMEAGTLPAAQAVRLVAQVCRAIDYAHRRGVIHRDLKPENILVAPDGQPKILDFGLAGLRAQPNLDLTRDATAMGTLHYMAPEQRRDARAVDERADLYSLGVVLYEALTGEVPVGRFRLPSRKVPGLDPRLDRIVCKALDTDPESRYRDAATMAAALDAVVPSAAPAAAGGPPAAPPVEGRGAGGRGPLVALAIAVALVAGAVAFQGSCGGSAEVPPGAARAPAP